MLKKSLTYKDFNGNEQTEDFYFNLTKAEIVELDFSFEGGLLEAIKKMTESNDRANLLYQFKRIILMSYGEKSEDGKRFLKNQEIRDGFAQHAAYDALFMELAQGEDAMVAFIQGILPRDLVEASLASGPTLTAIPGPEIPPIRIPPPPVPPG